VKISNSSIILGIDPGIADTGYGVISQDVNQRLNCLAYGSIRTPASQETADRLVVISHDLSRLLKKYRPRLVAVEQLFFAKNVKTALIVGLARGVVMLTAKQHGLDLVEFTPLQVKQAVAAYGQAGKLQVQKMVKLLLNLNKLPQPDDAADALAIAICAAHSLKSP
jgi:crossover junction endodeoxyribonuclease RuvC